MDDILEEIIDIVKSIEDEDQQYKIGEDYSLKKSAFVDEILGEVEEHFDVVITDEDEEGVETLRDLAVLVDDKVREIEKRGEDQNGE